MFQEILAIVLLIIGIIYAAAVLKISHGNKDKLAAEKGSLVKLAAAETAVYFFGSFGFPDFLLNTLVLKYSKCTDDRALPGTLVAGCVTPGTIIAFSLLRADSNPISPVLLITCSACVIAGSIVGSRLVGRFDGAKIKKIMQWALVCSFVILVIRMILSAGATGTATSLSGVKLAVAAVMCFVTAAINMFGIPMKPTWTALFLVLGLSSITSLTLLLLIGALGPIAGGSRMLRSGVYHRKTVLCATLAGSVGAILGTSFAISIPSLLLNATLMVIMLIAIITMFKK